MIYLNLIFVAVMIMLAVTGVCFIVSLLKPNAKWKDLE